MAIVIEASARGVELDLLSENQIGKTHTALYDDAETQLLAFDAVLSEQHTLDSKISQHPAEDGVKFSDMQVTDPVVLNLSIIKSNHPLQLLTLPNLQNLAGLPQLGAGLADGLVQQFTDGFGATDLLSKSQIPNIPGISNRPKAAVPILAQARGLAIGTSLAVLTEYLNDSERIDVKAFDVLRELILNSTRLVIVTPFVSYTNMLLKSINVTKDRNSTQSLSANLVFQEVLIYNSQSQKLKSKGTDSKVTDQQQNTQKQGEKPKTDSSDGQINETNKTVAAAVGDAVVDAVDKLFGSN